jgi:hypothetical protein
MRDICYEKLTGTFQYPDLLRNSGDVLQLEYDKVLNGDGDLLVDAASWSAREAQNLA